MKRFKKTIGIIVAAIMCLSVMAVGVLAAEITDAQWTEVQQAVTDGKISANDVLAIQATGATDTRQIVVTVNGVSTLVTVDASRGSELYNKISTTTNPSDISGKLPTVVINPNVEAVEQGLEGAMGVIETVLGVLIWLIMIGVTIWTIADILFLSYPVFNEYIENQSNAKDGGGKIISRLVTREAKEAYKEANSGNGGNVWLLYLKKRIVAVVLIAVCLYFVTIGDIGFVIRIVTKLVSGVIKGISNFANS